MPANYPATVAALAAGLAAGDYSSVEITAHFLARIAAIDGTLNAFISVCGERALEQARVADRRRAGGAVAGRLAGIPYANKDVFCTRGVRTSCGSRMLDSFIAPYTATLVDRLETAGMVMLGKTNMDEFAMGSSNETSYYGPVRNPWGTDRVPGGSSGGSACAVAARLVPFATGTDTGGSIRQPAAFCGVTGLKPTYGRISRYGLVAFASSLDQGGPITLTAEDAGILMNHMAAFDPRDSTSVERPDEDFTRLFRAPPAGIRMGVPKEFFDASLDPAVGARIESALTELERLGARRIEISLPHMPLSIPAYYVIASAECSSNLSRYDGVRYGYRCADPVNLEDLYGRTRAEGFGAEVKRRVLVGTYALSAGYYDAYYRKAQQVRRLIQRDFTAAFDRVDVIVGPTSPTIAFALGQKSHDPVTMYLSDVYTTAVNLAGLPGLSIPAGFVAGLPVGLQLIGGYFDEARLLQLAHHYQQVTNWHLAAPALASGVVA